MPNKKDIVSTIAATVAAGCVVSNAFTCPTSQLINRKAPTPAELNDFFRTWENQVVAPPELPIQSQSSRARHGITHGAALSLAAGLVVLSRIANVQHRLSFNGLKRRSKAVNNTEASGFQRPASALERMARRLYSGVTRLGRSSSAVGDNQARDKPSFFGGVVASITAGAVASSSLPVPASAADVNTSLGPVTLVIEGQRYTATPRYDGLTQKGLMVSAFPRTPADIANPPPAAAAAEGGKKKEKPVFEDFPELQKLKDEGTLLVLVSTAMAFAAKAGYDYLFPPDEEEEQPDAPMPVAVKAPEPKPPPPPPPPSAGGQEPKAKPKAEEPKPKPKGR